VPIADYRCLIHGYRREASGVEFARTYRQRILHMSKTNNARINPAARLRFEAALETYGQAVPRHLAAPNPDMILQLPPAGDVSFVAAQTAAREWADKALVLGQAGDTEQSRHARLRAEAWLVKMLAIEVQDGRLENDKLPIARPRTQRRSPPAALQEPKLNNAALRTWPRSRLREPAE
jgi:hypothetical protein